MHINKIPFKLTLESDLPVEVVVGVVVIVAAWERCN